MEAIRAAKADLDGIVRSDDHSPGPIGRDQERQQRIAEFQRLIDEGLRSGISADTMRDLLTEARRRAGTVGGNGL
jgi:antitoxin ParD1/3/4